VEHEELAARIAEVRKRLEEAKAALPAHSVTPAQWQRVEELEEELARLEALAREAQS